MPSYQAPDIDRVPDLWFGGAPTSPLVAEPEEANPEPEEHIWRGLD
jgi:hypothetical protein